MTNDPRTNTTFYRMNLSTRNYETAGFIEWSAGWNARVTWGIETVGPFRKKSMELHDQPLCFSGLHQGLPQEEKRGKQVRYISTELRSKPHLTSAKITPV